MWEQGKIEEQVAAKKNGYVQALASSSTPVDCTQPIFPIKIWDEKMIRSKIKSPKTKGRKERRAGEGGTAGGVEEVGQIVSIWSQQPKKPQIWTPELATNIFHFYTATQAAVKSDQ